VVAQAMLGEARVYRVYLGVVRRETPAPFSTPLYLPVFRA